MTDSSVEQIESELDILFRHLGYQRVTETVGDSPDFDNADYVNYDKKIAIELKVVDKDYFETGGIIHKMRMVVAKPENVDEEGLGFYTISFPETNREGKVDSIEEPLRRTLKKANRQLRETIRELLDGSGNGLVLLALNMKTAISPLIVRNLVHDLLSAEFRSISGVMICNPKVLVEIEGTPSYLFVHTSDGNAPELVLEEIERIGDKWCEFSSNGGHESGLIAPPKPGIIEFPPW